MFKIMPKLCRLFVPLVCAAIVLPYSAQAETKPKYSAVVPDSIITPNKVESKYLGKLAYTDGAPSLESFQKARDFVDTADAVRVFLSGIPVASIQGLLAG
jgi:hypothetical protein